MPPDALTATGGPVTKADGVGEEEARAALIAGLACYFLWGLAPVLFKAIAWTGASAWETTAHRCLWSVFMAGALVFFARKGPELYRILREPRTMGWLMASTLLIGVNWSLFTWSTQNGHNIEASLGYYLNPLLNMAAGALLFRERLNRAGWIAVGLAAAGVLLQGVALGRLPLISLVLAFSFCAYGIIRKRVTADAQTGLLVEAFILAWPGLIYIGWLQMQGSGHAGDPVALALFIFSGAFTVAPLALFSWAARRMPLSTMGFLQFIAPTMQFGWGVAFGEPMNALRLASFGFIWAGAAVFVAAAWSRSRRERAQAAIPPVCAP